MTINMQQIISIAKTVWDIASSEDVRDLAHDIFDYIKQNSQHKEDFNEDQYVSKALHRMNTKMPPKIALAGMTSSGKSSLINCLFGEPLSTVKRTPDTTDSVLMAKFPSGLTIYDTPGIAGDEKNENVTRLFLGLPQDPDLGLVDKIPFKEKSTSPKTYIQGSIISEKAPIDAVLFVVDLSRTLTRLDKKALRTFYLELEKKYSPYVVATGTHLDVLQNECEDEERNQMMSTYGDITGNCLIPVSNSTKEGLAQLVLNFFRILPDKVSLSKMQESLTIEQKLGRLSFVLNESSRFLAELSMLKGNQHRDILLGTMSMFAMISVHYSVEENVWQEYNGDLVALSEHAATHGVKRIKTPRDPEGFWEYLRSLLFRTKFFDTVNEYHPIGLLGLKEVLPRIYSLLSELEQLDTKIEPQTILEQLDNNTDDISKYVTSGRIDDLTSLIYDLFLYLFEGTLDKQ